MKKTNLVVIFLGMLTMFTACEEKGEEISKVVLEVQPAVLDFPAIGATKKVMVNSSDVDWSFVSEVEWCKVERVENQLEVTVDPYNSLELRSTKVIVKAKNAEDQIVNVRQSAAAEATLTITPDTLEYFAAKEPEPQLLVVETNQSKVVISEQPEDWCVVTISDDCTTITVVPETNKETKEKSTSFTVRVGEEPNIKEMPFIVKQNPARLVEVDKIELNEIGYRVVVPVDAEDGSYTANAADEWCSVKTTARGLEICAPPFEEETERKTTVSVLIGDKVMATIGVTQIGGKLELHDEYYHNGKLVGIVGRIDDMLAAFGLPTTIYVVALEEKEVQWCTEKSGITGITVGTSPDKVLPLVKELPDWKTKYPAFAYCDEMCQKTGMDNWTLGDSQDKVYYIYRNDAGNEERGKELNRRMEECGGSPFTGLWYWLNGEKDDFVPEADPNTKIIEGYWIFNGGQYTNKWFYKNEKHYARCIWSCQYSKDVPTGK